MATDAPKSTRDKISEKSVPKVDHLPFYLVDKRSNKTTKLLANSGDSAPLDGQNRWYTYSFKRPVFIYRAVIHVQNYPGWRDFEIEITDENGKVSKSKKPAASNKVVLTVSEFCKQIRFKPPKAYFSADKLVNSIEIFGFDKSAAGKFIQFARDIERLKIDALSQIEKREAIYRDTIEKAEAAEAKVAEAKKELGTLKGQADRQRSTIRRLESERADLTTKTEALADSLEKNQRELTELRDELSARGRTKQGLDEQVEGLREKLGELRANIDLFPSELDSFVKQGRRNTTTLFWLALTPIAIIAIMFGILISGAVDLTTQIDPKQEINLYALIASRTPYVVVALAIITACYQIARSFIAELIQTNRQRLNLTKIGIIAKDVSASAETGLNLSDVERYGLRVRLKMELLKDHLQGYITPDLDIKLPNRITNYLPFSNFIEERRERARNALKQGVPEENTVTSSKIADSPATSDSRGVEDPKGDGERSKKDA